MMYVMTNEEKIKACQVFTGRLFNYRGIQEALVHRMLRSPLR